MNSKKKLALIGAIVIGYIVWVSLLQKPEAKLGSLGKLAEESASTDQAVIKIDDPKPKEKETKAPELKQEAALVDVKKESFIFQEFNPPVEKFAVPVVSLKPEAKEILIRLIQINSLKNALYALKGHGYVSFNTKEIEKYYPKFVHKLFDKFATSQLPNFFWNELAGDGQIYFQAPELKQKIGTDLESLKLSKELITFVDDQTLKIDLNFSGYKINIEESVRLNIFFKKYGEYFNLASIRGEGNIALMLSSLQPLYENLEKIILDLQESENLGKFLDGLKVDGLILLDINSVRLYQAELGPLLNVDKVRSLGMVLQQSALGEFRHEIDFQQIAKVHQNNLTEQKKFKENGEVAPVMYQTYLDLPIEVTGDKLLRFSTSFSKVNHSFAEQKLFTPGTSIEAVFNMKMEDLGEKLEDTFLDVLGKLEVDRHITYSLSHTQGQGIFFFPIELQEDQLEKLPFYIETAVDFVGKYNPKPTHKLYLEFASIPEVDQLLASPTYNILTQEDFDDKRRILLTMNEPLKVKLFQELAARISPLVDLSFKGYLEIGLDSFSSDRHAQLLLERALADGVINLGIILKGIKGSGRIEIHPSVMKFFDQDLLEVITLLFKNNQSSYERWKLINAQFKIRVPDTFDGEAEPDSLRQAYEYINKGATPKIKEQRVKKLIQSFQQNDNEELVVPEKLNELLDILSDDRKITDVLKDKKDEGF